MRRRRRRRLTFPSCHRKSVQRSAGEDRTKRRHSRDGDEAARSCHPFHHRLLLRVAVVTATATAGAAVGRRAERRRVYAERAERTTERSASTASTAAAAAAAAAAVSAAAAHLGGEAQCSRQIPATKRKRERRDADAREGPAWRRHRRSNRGDAVK